MDAILQRKFVSLGKYVTPRELLDEVLPVVETILGKVGSEDVLTDHQRNKYLEKYQAAFLGFVNAEIVRKRAEITVCVDVKENEDFDCVLKAVEPDGRTIFRPFQLKSVPCHQMNQHIEVQKEINKLKKYGAGLAVAFWVNRDIRLDLSNLKFDELNIEQLWFFGDSPSGAIVLQGDCILNLRKGTYWVAEMRNGRPQIRRWPSDFH